MIPSFNKVHNRFKINGRYLSFEGLKDLSYFFIKEGARFEVEIGYFLQDWLDTKEYVLAKTSGSTGQPKTIKLQKQAMVNSAIATGDFFKLKPGDSALLCLPATYIAGKMMLVRAIVLGLELQCIQPTTTPKLVSGKSYDFCAMIPAQVEKMIPKLDVIKTLIVGGAAVSFSLKKQLEGLKVNAFETYGMTETITHIAVKPINNQAISNAVFTTLPNIEISQNNKGCLIINAPLLTSEVITTNDVVKCHSKTTFEWLGRIDNVINSGGVKLFPEKIEATLQSKIKTRFFISSEADSTFGEVVILVLEAKNNSLNQNVFSGLTAIEKPKKIYAITAFAETSSGKINRGETLRQIQ